MVSSAWPFRSVTRNEASRQGRIELTGAGAGLKGTALQTGPNRNLLRFHELASFDSGVFESLGRYGTELWRQVNRRPPSRGTAWARKMARSRYDLQCPGVPVGFFGVIMDPQTDPPVARTAKP
jgi:hypothetical protein